MLYNTFTFGQAEIYALEKQALLKRAWQWTC